MVACPEYSQSAYRHGDYVAKYGVFPLGQAQKDIENLHIKDSDSINCISQHTRNFHMQHKVTYSFCAQMLQNLEEQPVEDIGIEWDEKKYPFEQIATLEFDPQDSWLPEFRAWWDDRITVNSWHGLKEHKPLGSTNRLRRVGKLSTTTPLCLLKKGMLTLYSLCRVSKAPTPSQRIQGLRRARLAQRGSRTNRRTTAVVAIHGRQDYS